MGNPKGSEIDCTLKNYLYMCTCILIMHCSQYNNVAFLLSHNCRRVNTKDLWKRYGLRPDVLMVVACYLPHLVL